MPAPHTGGEVTTGGGDCLSAGSAGGVNNGPVIYKMALCQGLAYEREASIGARDGGTRGFCV
jgi:hypothetical protein